MCFVCVFVHSSSTSENSAPLMKCLKITRFISLTYHCPVGGPRFSVWDHIHLAPRTSPNSVLALALVESIPGHDCKLYASLLHS